MGDECWAELGNEVLGAFSVLGIHGQALMRGVCTTIFVPCIIWEERKTSRSIDVSKAVRDISVGLPKMKEGHTLSSHDLSDLRMPWHPDPFLPIRLVH